MPKIDVVMPKLGESITEGTIIKWCKKQGDFVKKDETLLEISTDKVDSEIPSPVEGRVAEILFEVNKTVAVDTVIARIEAQTTGGFVAAAPQDLQGLSVTQQAGSAAQKAQRSAVSNRFYSPLVMNIARQEGLAMEELAQISGTGAEGRVTKNDVLNYLKARGGAHEAPQALVAAAVLSEDRRIPMDAIRQKIAKHMRRSLDTAAHVYCLTECDVTEVMNLIKTRGAHFEKEQGFKLTFTPFVIEAAARALKEFPRVNSSLEGDTIIEKAAIGIGLAVATPQGLIVPVIKNAGRLDWIQLARLAHDLATRARDKKLIPDDVNGSTLAITNFGVFGTLAGFPIINQPNTAILGVGAVQKRPVVLETERGDSIAVRSMLYLSLSFDHRVVDGDLGGRFLQKTAQNLQTMASIVTI